MIGRVKDEEFRLVVLWYILLGLIIFLWVYIYFCVKVLIFMEKKVF